MKFMTVLLLSLISLSIYAMDFEGKYLEPKKFEKMTSMQKNFWNQNANTCYATTVCPNGRQVWCQTYGYQAVANGSFANTCRWQVIPGRGVRCQGYQQQMGPYGYMWAWVDIPVACF